MSTSTERVGRYQLLEPIGVGPGGTVSRAKVFGVAGFERQFAVKRFHPELTSSATMAQALSAAARAYGGLEHPRIARMSEFGVAQGTTFTAVEYVAGLDALRLVGEARATNTALAAGGVLALVSQAARAVGYAHGRGLTHLGLAPTNVIVTPEGDVKITDFGILSATLPPRPIDHARLANRIQYLAPEQLANEATSAATDVFALGVLAYELVTGQRTFKGETPQQIAQSVMAGPPGEPPLPRPIVRVLQRCLARSPFERFPDARALADALDAALRVAPVPGTRKDIGAQVKATLDRLAELHSGELSGMVALNLGTANMLRGPVAPVATLGSATPDPATAGRGSSRDSAAGLEMATTEFVRPDTPVAGPAPLVGPSEIARAANASSTVPDLPKVPMTTVTGLAPPPIPVPKGITPPPLPTPPPIPSAPSTLLGVANAAKIGVPSQVKPVLGAVPPPRPPAVPRKTPPPIPVARPRTEPPGEPAPATIEPVSSEPPPLEVSAAGSEPADHNDRVDHDPLAHLEALEHRAAGEPPERPSETPVSPLRALEAMPPAIAPHVPLVELLSTPVGTPRLPTESEPMETETVVGVPEPSLSVEMSIVEPPPDDDAAPEPMAAAHELPTHEMSPLVVEMLTETSTRPTTEVPPLVDEAHRAGAMTELPAAQQAREVTPVASAPPSLSQPIAVEIPTIANASARQYPVERAAPPPVAVSAPQPPRSRLPWIIAGVLTALALGAAAFFVIPMLRGDDATSSGGGGPIAARKDAGAAVGGEAAVVASADAATATPGSDGGVAVAAADAGATPGDAQIVATDAGAKPATSDSLSISSTPAGARVFIDGADTGVTPLKLPGTPDRHTIAILLAGHELYVAQVDGHGAFAIPLKEVTPTGGDAGIKVKCKQKDRYYVFVDGKPTGQTCPTERIDTVVGPHVVEVYDIVSETRRKWEINVVDTRLSYRVKID